MSRKRALLSDSSDDEDLEEQLLSLSKKKTKAAAPQPDSDDSDNNKDDSDSDTSTDDGDDDWSHDGKSSKKKTKKKVATKVTKKRAISSSEEEGEINDEDSDNDNEDEKKSDDNRASSGSSSSSDEGSGDEDLQAFDDGLDEDLMGDEEDRRKMSQMTEVEREQELFNRMEKREALKTRREIQSKLHAERKKELKQSKKEKGEKSHKNKDDVYNGISGGKETRKKNVDDKKKSALDEIKEKRQQKKEKMDALIKKKEPLNTNDVFSDDDDDDDDDRKKSDGSDKEKEKDDSSSSSDSSDNDDGSDKEEEDEEEDVFLDSLAQLESVRLSRHKLEQWVHLPFFDEIVIGCYIRMGIGQHDGRAVYRVAEIADVTETQKVYTLGKTKTNKGLKIKHGLQERVFRMEYISNQPFTESEFNKWKDEMKSQELPLPTVKQLKAKTESIKKSKNYTYKEDDVEGIIKEKAKFRKNPFNYAVKKNNLLMEKALASQTMDYAGLERITNELDDLEDRAVFLDKQRSGTLGNISFINERNRKTNVYAAEEAVIAEAKLEKTKEKNPFVRRRTIPQMITKGSELLKVQRVEKAQAEHLKANRGKPPPESTPSEGASEIDSLLFSPAVGRKQENGNNSNEDSDLFNVHDFDVQIDVSIPESRPGMSLTPKPMVGQRDGITRRSLNLDEYKKRKGLM